jgi:hypothetical protein
MLISMLIAYLLFGGSGATPFLDLVKKFESETRTVVLEPERRRAIDSVLDEIKTAIKKEDHARGQSVKALVKVGENHAATAADLLSILNAQERTNVAFQDRMIALHGDLKARLAPTEWAAIVAKTAPKPAAP